MALAPEPGPDWSAALSQLVLAAVSLHAAVRSAPVSSRPGRVTCALPPRSAPPPSGSRVGPHSWPVGAGLAGASGVPLAVAPDVSTLPLCRQASRGAAAGFLLQALAATCTLAPGLRTREDCPSGAWVATVIGLPLLAFDFHWVNGDRSSANLMLGAGMALAVAGEHLGPEGCSVAGQAVLLVVAVTIAIVAVFTANTYGVWGGALLGAAGLLSRLDQDGLPLPRGDACRWALAAGSWAYCRALRTQRLQWE